MFYSKKLVVFCDGDFWHGRGWEDLKAALARRANSEYWIAKIAANRARDRRVNRALRKLNWRVIRIWETDIRRNPEAAALRVKRALAKHKPPRGARPAAVSASL